MLTIVSEASGGRIDGGSVGHFPAEQYPSPPSTSPSC